MRTNRFNNGLGHCELGEVFGRSECIKLGLEVLFEKASEHELPDMCIADCSDILEENESNKSY